MHNQANKKLKIAIDTDECVTIEEFTLNNAPAKMDILRKDNPELDVKIERAIVKKVYNGK